MGGLWGVCGGKVGLLVGGGWVLCERTSWVVGGGDVVDVGGEGDGLMVKMRREYIMEG